MQNHSVPTDSLNITDLYIFTSATRIKTNRTFHISSQEQLYKETTMAEAIKRALHSLKPENQENQGDTSTQQMPSQAQKKSDSQKSQDISSMTVEKQFDTDYDKAGNLVSDPVHFDPKEQDIVRASLDDFSDH